jgi:hypothetical protein
MLLRSHQAVADLNKSTYLLPACVLSQDFSVVLFTLEGNAAELNNCKRVCDADAACLGIYVFPFRSTIKVLHQI